MTTQQDAGYWLGDAGRIRDRAARWLKAGVQTAFSVAKARTRPARAHLVEHAYTWAGFGCISAASFTHSVFTGLIVTGALALVFEWKAGD